MCKMPTSGRMLTTSLRKLLATALVLGLASCGTDALRPPPASGLDEPPPSRFQQALDAHGIPLSLPPGRAILVNVPSFELVAFEDGTPVLWSRVIVGTPEMRTPRIDTFTDRVIFRPSWRPTPDMVASGEVPDRVFPAGPGNPMGAVAITLETRLDVALHDTNQPHLFDREWRAFSHGCIRVQKWEALAAWLLDHDEEWVRTMASGPAGRGVVTPSVPVLIRYYTRFPTEDGTVMSYPDLYSLGPGATAFRAQARKSAPAAARPETASPCRIAT